MISAPRAVHVFFFNDTATTEIYTLSLHDALPISPSHLDRGLFSHEDSGQVGQFAPFSRPHLETNRFHLRSEEHTSELQSRLHLVCRLLLEKKKTSRRHWHRSRSPTRSAPPQSCHD